MSELKTMATTMWTQLLEGMRADGLIAHNVTQSGPATSKVIVEACQAIIAAPLPAQRAPWLGMDILPQPGREVVARNHSGALHILHYDDVAKSWFKGKLRVGASRFTAWTFVDNGALL